MKKNSTKGYAILGIIFLLISIIAFAVPTMKTTTFWIAYFFTAIAIVSQIVSWKNAFEKEDTLKSKFLGLPIVYIGIVYLVAQIVAFAVFTAVPTLPIWSPLVVCVAILGISAIFMIVGEAGRGEIERVEAKVQKKVFFIKELQADVELLADAETDSSTKAALRQLAEKIRFSDPMSSEQLVDLESKISEKAAELKTAVSRMEIVTEINLLLDERNKKCRLGK